MCGIAGIITKPDVSLVDLPERLVWMARTMQHRGPDDEGIYISPDQRLGLANRRLAIRDLSPLGHMPMGNAAGTIWITYNGEIYNADELRHELELCGFVFCSTSDTEVILYAYEAWGNRAVDRLRGMFAFAIHDLRDGGKFLLARDHMGIKPVYYALTEKGFIFASEIKTLLASGLVTSKISATGLVGYLLTGSVPNPHTIYEQVHALEPACFLEFNVHQPEEFHKTEYWQLPNDIVEIRSYREAVDQVQHLLTEAVRIRLVSDVPLGAFLSGGLDSSSLVALMRQIAPNTIRTCSMIFNETEFSEESYARIVSKELGTEHYERVITAQDVANEFDNILLAMDQPTVDGVNSYFVSQTAREAGLTVALSGLGGDELFGGYKSTFQDIPKIANILNLLQVVPGTTSSIAYLLNFIPRHNRWQRLQDALLRPSSLASAYLTRRGLFSPREVKQLVHPDIWSSAIAFDPVSYITQRSHYSNNQEPFSWVSRAELRTYTHNQLLRDTDVMSMWHSLEVRVPILDKILVGTVLRFPEKIKGNENGYLKPLLASAVEKILPKMVLERSNKQGFTFPFDIWLRGSLSKRTRDIIEGIKGNAPLDANSVHKLVQGYNTQQVHWSRVWGLVALYSIYKN